MTSKSKLIVASAIVVAIAGLIALDLALFQKGKKAETASGDTFKVITGDSQPKDDTSKKDDKTREGTQPKDDFKNTTPKIDEIKKDGTTTKKDNGTEFLPLDLEPKEPFSELYVVQDKDNFWKIAEKKYGNGSLSYVIQKANPDVKPLSLKPGMKIVVPPKPDSADSKNLKDKDKMKQPSDDKSKEFISGNEYIVKNGDCLWNIAAKFTKGKGINSMMDKIAAANPDKMKNSSTTLRIGWKLTIPN